MHLKRNRSLYLIITILISASFAFNPDKNPKATLVPSEKFYFNSMVDCNMAEAWVADTFRIFPGKTGEDPLWGEAHDLKYGDGRTPDATFKNKPEQFTEVKLPPNVKPSEEGLHGAVWFETIYQNSKDKSGKTLYAVYHNENYPETFPYNEKTGKGYINANWPEGLTGPTTPAAVCRIGIMKSVDGGKSWQDKGVFIEDDQPRMILKPINNSITFAGGVGDPSAVANGDHLYLFYSEYGYAGKFDPATWDRNKEWSGQCISVARIKISDLDNPKGKAKRWDGKGFNISYDGIGTPIKSLQIPPLEGGAPISQKEAKYYWGPSVSWNYHLNAWVMLMAKTEAPKWEGNSIYISFNRNKDLSKGSNSQQWTKPELLIKKPGHKLWYPSLQPTNSDEDIKNRNTCLKLGKKARLFYKDDDGKRNVYWSEYTVQF